MSLTIPQYTAIYKLYSDVVNIRGDEAFDANGNQVKYDISSVNAEVANQEAEKAQAQQTADAHRQSAIAKLSALGLTADEITALGVK